LASSRFSSTSVADVLGFIFLIIGVFLTSQALVQREVNPLV
jgi:hypothetical protein